MLFDKYACTIKKGNISSQFFSYRKCGNIITILSDFASFKQFFFNMMAKCKHPTNYIFLCTSLYANSEWANAFHPEFYKADTRHLSVTVQNLVAVGSIAQNKWACEWNDSQAKAVKPKRSMLGNNHQAKSVKPKRSLLGNNCQARAVKLKRGMLGNNRQAKSVKPKLACWEISPGCAAEELEAKTWVFFFNRAPNLVR